jgi:hypothetical protein
MTDYSNIPWFHITPDTSHTELLKDPFDNLNWNCNEKAYDWAEKIYELIYDDLVEQKINLDIASFALARFFDMFVQSTDTLCSYEYDPSDLYSTPVTYEECTMCDEYSSEKHKKICSEKMKLLFAASTVITDLLWDKYGMTDTGMYHTLIYAISECTMDAFGNFEITNNLRQDEKESAYACVMSRFSCY